MRLNKRRHVIRKLPTPYFTAKCCLARLSKAGPSIVGVSKNGGCDKKESPAAAMRGEAFGQSERDLRKATVTPPGSIRPYEAS
jgi:hypothetical protein